MTDRLESLQRKQSQIRAQIQQIQAKERTKEKKKQTRRKFLIGDAIMSQLESGQFSQADLTKLMDEFLTRPKDRDLFGLETEVDSEAIALPEKAASANSKKTKASSSKSPTASTAKKAKRRRRTILDADKAG
ncbi:hypothetical protein [cf. Phormidesmis sp. LEGE 11477]|uniref:hypothetical protein n=1 Tax=cf. Phormidesmis sp. LEGE 11477 TaxID=1828680 RepID=UPI0018808769|nr:hypothetical protein [cf. Phormidesmis sp. LEGE 11477]MBE9062872.1 hypothetical protein [cf. Phormidesmis sp. LEGE 11477]